MTDRYFADCCYGSDHQHAGWEPCPMMLTARRTLAATLDAAGPSWEDLADAIENGTNYANDTIHVSIALRAIITALETPNHDQ